MTESFIIDCHAHFYPTYDVFTFFRSASANLGFHAPESTKILCFTERSSENYFYQFASNDIPGLDVTPTSDPNVLHIQFSEGEIFLVSGYQYVTIEKIEVLALNSLERLTDGLSVFETISAIIAEGAVPVLPWSPGKWLGSRRKVIQSVIQSELFNECFLGDIFGHPWWFYEPLLAQHQLKVLLGSDTLPQSGDELSVGRSAVFLEANLSENMIKISELLNGNRLTLKSKKISTAHFFQRRFLPNSI